MWAKQYELKDHLGNVRVVVGDRKNLNTDTDELSADVIAYNNYYPFGMPQPGRNFDGQEYRYGFQGQEKDSELKGEGNHLSFRGFGYDSRIGRRLGQDPLAGKYPSWTTYVYTLDNPLNLVDKDGKEPTDWYRNLITNEIVWFDGSKNIDGYVNEGYYYTEIDANSNKTFFNGDNQSKYYNGEFLKSYKAEGIGKIVNYAADNLVSPVMEGTQILGYTFYGTGVMFKEMIKDIEQGGDGTGLKVDAEMPIYEFNNGKIVKTDLNDQSEKEIITNGVSATTTLTPVAKTGNSVMDEIIDYTIGEGVSKVIEEGVDSSSNLKKKE